MRSAVTEYICGLNTRTESCSCSGISDTVPTTNVRYEYGPLRARILNRDLGYGFEVEPATRTYTAYPVNKLGRPVGAKPQKIKLPGPSGRTVHSYLDTIDTGEREEQFGYTARRVITRKRQVRDEQVLSESECEGWYIDAPAAWANLYPPLKADTYTHLISGNEPMDDYKFSETGTRETGFALVITWRHRSSFRDETGNVRIHENVHREEITEFSEDRLGPDLFVPALNFKRVPQLPDGTQYKLAYRLRLRWEVLKDSLSLPKKIAKFTA